MAPGGQNYYSPHFADEKLKVLSIHSFIHSSFPKCWGCNGGHAIRTAALEEPRDAE